MKLSFANTFARIGALTYGGGIIAHVLNLIGVLPVEQMPTGVHVVLIVLAGYAVTGLLYFRERLSLKNGWEKLFYALLVVHLGLSVLMHVYSVVTDSNTWITFFPSWYSLLAIGYFAVFGYYCLLLNERME